MSEKQPVYKIPKASKADWPDVMVDIETTGTTPGRHGILQIAAVRFDLMSMDVDVTDTFNCSLTMPTHLHWEESTRRWWLEDKADLLQEILSVQKNWLEVMQEFAAWVGTSQPTFWSKPTHFDFMFLSSYFKDAGLAVPFHYRAANDLNSWIRARYYPQAPRYNEYNIAPTEGPTHDAFNDIFHQLKLLFMVYEDTRQ